MFCKITLIGSDDSGQCFLHGRNIPCFRPHQYRLRHTTGDIVHFQLLIQRIKEGIRDGFKSVHLFQILCQIFITVSKQEFTKGHRVNLHKVDLTHRKRGRFRQSNTKQRTSAGNVILRCILAKILHRVNDLRAVLHLIKNDKGFFRHDFLTACQYKVL